MDSSGRKTWSAGAFLLACSLAIILSVMSGESMDRPKEFAYFFRITSRTVSTRSSSLTATRVADAPGRLTHIFLCIISSSSSNAIDGAGDGAGEGTGKPGARCGSAGCPAVVGSELTCGDEEVPSSTCRI